MATDFTYGNKTITTSGPTKPATKNSPGDVRTRVQTYADISTIPMPYIGMPIVVLEDETNENKMTEYRVKSLKANTLGVQDTVVNEVVRLKDFLEISNNGNVSQGDIEAAVNNYLTEHPVQSGATAEQAAQIDANKAAIGDENSGLTKGLNDIATLTIPGFVPSAEVYEFEEVDNSHMNDIDSKTNSLTDKEFLADWYDIYVGLQSDGMLVSKNIVGVDESSKYYVYEYDFKPKKYNRTILLTSGLHSYEQSAQFGLAYFIKDLMTTPYRHEGFKYIRENVRIKIIPMLNPWGYNQNPQIYGNVNKVNPNRNFDFDGSWEAYPVKPNDEWNWKGTAPFSEQETKNIANWLYYNKEIADFWIDCHTGNGYTDKDIWCLYQSYNPLKSKIESARKKLVNRIKSKYGVSSVNDYAQIDYVNSLKIQWSELATNIPMMVLEQAPLNPKWKTGAYEANGGSIREYATQLYVFIQEMLSCENVKFNLLDYIYSLRDDIFNNSCKQIPYYANSPYRMLVNAGGDTVDDSPGGSEIVGETYNLKVNNGSCSSANGTVSSSTTRLFSDYIAIDSSTLSITKNTSNFMLLLRYFDKDKNYISANVGNFASTLTETVPTNTKYVVLQISKANNTDTITSSDVSGTITINGKIYKLVYDSSLSLTTSIPTSGFALNKTSISIMEGDTEQLTATLNGLDVTSSTNWTSDNANATVVDGLVTGMTVGNATITASKDGESATCSVNVVDIRYLTCTNTAISSANGTETSNNARLSTDYIPVTITDNKLKLICTNSYQYAIRLYNSSKQYLNAVPGTAYKNSGLGWGTDTENISHDNLNSNVAYIRILFRADSTGTTPISTIDGTLTVDDTEYTLTM